jgi:hypothetical protein
MAKNKKGGRIEIEVTDGGSLKDLGKNARRAGKDVGSVAKNTAESDRRLKSLSQQTSNTTKAFSKQAQTIEGGLVPIYATLAAQVFAVTAAFRFFQDSFDLKNLMEGQKAMGAVTGTAFGFLTKQVQDATNNMLSFKEAAQAVAIGTAGGLSRDQLERLGVAAKNVSIALGRDLTDSFNRLIRGATKAEPELLDELGIVLRLDPALRKYAQSVNKSVKELTPFQRTQAVTNEILEQAESKYAAISKILDPDAFALGQFGKEFSDLMDSFKLFVAEGLLPFVKFFKENVAALFGALLLFIKPILNSLLPNFDTAIAKSMARATQLEALSVRTAKFGGMVQTGDMKGARKMSSSLLGEVGIKTGATKQLSESRIAFLQNELDARTGMFKDFTDEQVDITRRGLKEQKATLRTHKGAERGMYLKFETFMAKHMSRITGLQQKGMAKFFKFTKSGFKALEMAIGAMGFIGILLLAFDMLKNFAGFLGNTFFPNMMKAREETKQTVENLKTLNEEIAKMRAVRATGMLTGFEILEQTGNLLQTTDLPKLMQEFNQEADKGFFGKSEAHKNFKATATELAKVDSRFQSFSDAIKIGKPLTVEQMQVFKGLADEIQEASQASKRFADNQRTVQTAIRGVIDAGAKLPYADLTRSLRASIKDMDLALGGLAMQRTTLTTNYANAEPGMFSKGYAAITGFLTGGIEGFSKNIYALYSEQRLLNAELEKTSDQEKEVREELEFQNKLLSNYLSFQVKGLELNAKKLYLEQIALNNQLRGVGESTQFEKQILDTKKQKLAVAQAELKVEEALSLQALLKETATDEERRSAQANVDNALALVELERTRLQIVRQRVSIDLRSQMGQSDMGLGASERRLGLGLQGLTKYGKQSAANLNPSNIMGMANDLGITYEKAEAKIRATNQALAMNAIRMEFNEGVADRLGTALESGIGNALLAIVDGTKTAKEAFSEMTRSIIADIAKLAIRQAVMTMIFGGYSGGTTAPTGRSGGVMSSPGYRSFAGGGIATGPTSGYNATLHGTEAVVPLGNDRSIPVELKGSTGSINNITVNVTAGGVDMVGDDDSARSLGLAISQAVQSEIEKQQRPGGSLGRV